MYWETIATRWDVIQANIKQHWDRLSYQQISAVQGNRARFASLLQACYGLDQSQAEQQLSAWQQQQIIIDGHFYSTQTASTNSSNSASSHTPAAIH